jgi:chitin disaccharide deacetylase
MKFPRWTRAAASLVATLPAWLHAADAPSLVERLGYPAGSRVLIVNGDDSGMCHTANLATIESMEKGLMTSSTIMVPCPWFLEIANYAKAHPERDFGLHLVQTSEWRVYRWGPVAPRTEVPGLIDPEGYLWHEVPQVYAKAKPEEACIESRAQIRKALDAGVDVTHLDSHMGTLQLNPAYVEQYLKLAVEFDLPVRMASQETLEKFGGGGQRVAFAARGIVFPDDFVYEDLKDMPKDPNGYWKRKLASLKPGVTELYIHAGKPTDELKAITNSWKTRSEEFETFTNDPEVRAILEREKVIRIGWRPLRELQRKDRKGR